MSFKEKLIRAKKAVVMGALAVAAVIPSAKGQTVEGKATTNDVAVATASNESTKRKEMFESAVRTGAPREEIVKYIDFPEFIPVTKDGQFDKAKAEEWGKALMPYMKTLAEKGDKITTAEAYKAFKDATGQKNVSLEDFEQVCKVVDQIATYQKYKKFNIHATSAITLFVAALVLAGGVATLACGTGVYTDFVSSRQKGDSLTNMMIKGVWNTALTALAAITTYCFTSLALHTGADLIHLLVDTPEQLTQKIYAKTYNSYVSQAIKSQQKQFKQERWEQNRQLKQIEFEGAMKQIKGIQK